MKFSDPQKFHWTHLKNSAVSIENGSDIQKSSTTDIYSGDYKATAS